jgi:ferredoxin
MCPLFERDPHHIVSAFILSPCRTYMSVFFKRNIVLCGSELIRLNDLLQIYRTVSEVGLVLVFLLLMEQPKSASHVALPTHHMSVCSIVSLPSALLYTFVWAYLFSLIQTYFSLLQLLFLSWLMPHDLKCSLCHIYKLNVMFVNIGLYSFFMRSALNECVMCKSCLSVCPYVAYQKLPNVCRQTLVVRLH